MYAREREQYLNKKDNCDYHDDDASYLTKWGRERDHVDDIE